MRFDHHEEVHTVAFKGQPVHAFAIHPKDASRFYVLMDDGLYRSENNARKWEKVAEVPTNPDTADEAEQAE